MEQRTSKPIGLHDWWVVVPLVTVGALAWTSFLYAGLRARRPRWLAMAALYLGVLVAAFVADSIAGQTDTSETLAGLTLFGLAGGGFAHCIAIRRPFYDRIYGVDADYANAQRRLEVRDHGREIVAEDPGRARQLGIGRPDLPDSFDAELVDLNSAPAEVIASVAGVPRASAERVVAARDDAGEFTSVEDLDLLVNLPTHDVARLKDAGVCVPRD